MSKIYVPYRALGLCSSDLPFIIQFKKHSNKHYLPNLVLVGIKQIMELTFPIKSFTINVIFNPYGYGERLLLGSIQGALSLWNLRSRKQLYWFRGFGSAITCIQQAPALDVCAIGLADGRVILHNIRFDSSLATFEQDSGAINSIDFRTVGEVPGHDENSPLVLSGSNFDIYLLTGSSEGMVHTWRLAENGESFPVGEGGFAVHSDRVVSLKFIKCLSASDPNLLVTSSVDNSIKVIFFVFSICNILHFIDKSTKYLSYSGYCNKVSVFDRPDGSPRIMNQRSGHSLPPTCIAFWPGGQAGGSLLISCGADSLLRYSFCLIESSGSRIFFLNC
ncbi:unnamed protein product [Protopolystoma xenopodis]|uniref:WDR36/Utp21 N-terminal domain-containing protein n=1 Tax=Protopolystoma xenopodis TaxID=117903 RepID=A0A3S5CEN5_9PLAT|nr:unnamed protein product [Protopolystoma xenopodis]